MTSQTEGGCTYVITPKQDQLVAMASRIYIAEAALDSIYFCCLFLRRRISVFCCAGWLLTSPGFSHELLLIFLFFRVNTNHSTKPHTSIQPCL